jgi:solute carrier family 35 (UDP-galactose transporter), member B1
MLCGHLIGGKSYPNYKYFFVFCIVSGVIMFLHKPDGKHHDNDESYVGLALVGFSLLMNGGMAGCQEKMRAMSRPTSLNLMLFLNSWSSCFALIAVVTSGEIRPFFAFCAKNPEILILIASILIVGGCGQLFTTTMVTSYGVVPCCIVLTIRKFFNVLFSVLCLGNKKLTMQQWIAAGLIFTSLFADAMLSGKSTKCDKSESESETNTQCVKEIIEKNKLVKSMNDKKISLPV